MWIRLREPGVLRYHAVYTQWGGSYATWCGRFWLVAGAETTDDPPAKCACCVSRMNHPYLLPDKIRRLKHPETRSIAGLFAEAHGAGD